MRHSLLLALVVALHATAGWSEPATETASRTASEAPLIRVSSPEPATIVIDGTRCGTTPALVEVSPGAHRVLLTIGGRRISRIVSVTLGEVVEVDLREEPPAERTGAEHGEGEAPRRRAVRQASPQEPWARRVFLWPMVEVQLVSSSGSRRFDVPINPDVDTSGRSSAAFESGAFGLLGFKVSLFPFSRLSTILLRGLGIEGSAVFDVGLLVLNARYGEEVDASFTEAGASLVYNAVIGRHDRGGIMVTRLGWHRTEFFLGEVGNDIVPPFTYDTFRIEAGGRIPLGTRHMLVDVGLAYLATISVGDEATQAYGSSGTLPSTHGGEVHLGLLHRIGRIELALAWYGRWFRSEFDGTGQGWGQEPTTRMFNGGNGIETTGPTHDSIHQLRFSLGYRF